VGVLRAYEAVRRHAPRVNSDRATNRDIEKLAAAIRNGEFDI
jgi:histidine ammonia-lyase